MWKLQENILSKQDKQLASDFLIKSDRLTQFEYVKDFEKNWSTWQGCKFSTYVNSGSSADLIMLDAVKEYYNIDDFSEVLVPCVTWTTNITSVIQTRLTPVFVDVNLNDFSFDYEKIELSITSKTKIILITHLIGISANITKIKEIATKFNLIILEDCCESHGAKFEDTKVGNFGLASTFSFYWGHHMTTIEGGIICSNNEELNDLFILKRSHGLARELHPSKHQKYKDLYPDIDFNFLFLTQGYNFRNTELHAYIGIHQLANLDTYISIRNNNHDHFTSIINKHLKEFIYPIGQPGISSFCLPFLFKEKKYKLKLLNKFKEHNIETRPIISGNLLMQPCFTKYGDYKNFKNSQIVHENGFYIGNNQFINEEKISSLENLIISIF